MGISLFSRHGPSLVLVLLVFLLLFVVLGVVELLVWVLGLVRRLHGLEALLVHAEHGAFVLFVVAVTAATLLPGLLRVLVVVAPALLLLIMAL